MYVIGIGWNGQYRICRHIDMHRDACDGIVCVSENDDYEVPNERTRVTRLLHCIQADHIASIAAAKTTIEATPVKRDDFEEATDFLILNALMSKSMNHDHYIAAFDTADGITHDLRDVKIEDQFYTPHEYRELSDRRKMKHELIH